MRHLKLGFILHGVGRNWGDWRHPDMPADASTSFPFYLRQAMLAEAGKLDFLFVTDSIYIDEKSGPHYINRFEPLTILAALAAATSRIGLVGTASVTYSEPYNIARQFASLDHISGGRAGWNVVTTMMEGAAANFGRDAHPPHAVRYRMAGEYLDVVRGLWDSWEPDALVRDKASGVFFDPAKLHSLDHRGEFYKVRGPLNIARSPQGQPVIFQAGASGDGRAFAAQHADAIFVTHAGIDQARAYYREMKDLIARLGRDPDSVLILPSIAPIVGRTETEAEAKREEVIRFTTIQDAIAMLSWRFDGFDFAAHDLDGPFPDVPTTSVGSQLSVVQETIAMAKRERLTLREVAKRLSLTSGAFVGSGAKIVDEMKLWVDTQAADGFVIYESLPGQLEALVTHVIPLLQRAGLFREDYASETFRGNLGLEVPRNRYTGG